DGVSSTWPHAPGAIARSIVKAARTRHDFFIAALLSLMRINVAGAESFRPLSRLKLRGFPNPQSPEATSSPRARIPREGPERFGRGGPARVPCAPPCPPGARRKDRYPAHCAVRT